MLLSKGGTTTSNKMLPSENIQINTAIEAELLCLMIALLRVTYTVFKKCNQIEHF